MAIHRKEYEISNEDILILRDIVLLMSSYHLAITYVREKDGTDGRVCFTGNYWTTISTLSRFLQDYVADTNHIYVSGTQIEPNPNFFSDISGKHVSDNVFPDLNETNDKMLIYPDRWRLGAKDFKNYITRIIERIVEICKENHGKEIFIVALNARKASIINKQLVEVMGPNTPLVDYYRSDMTMGIENSARICIAIGLAELPSNTYDHQASGKNEEEKWINSQRLRRESVDAATWQTWSRVKDPEGKEESRVYCIGVREERIRSVISWGPGRKLVLVTTKSGTLPDGTTWKQPVFRIAVNELINPPRILTGNHDAIAGRARRDIMDWVQGVKNYNPDLIISEFVKISPIINNRGIFIKLGIYNNPKDFFEIQVSAVILKHLLVARDDCYGVQQDHGWIKCLGHCITNQYVMINHIKGQNTVGLYQISLDDKVRWICFDIDDHEGEGGAEAIRIEVRKLLEVLYKYGIPFLLEASGSPNSYHVWILLKPTKTRTAYQFSRRIKSEAGIDCEVFPKQKGLNKNYKYGNLVKVPLGINRKTGKKSQFIDPDTFEPYMGIVPIPGIISLLDIEEPKEALGTADKIKITKRNREKTIHTPSRLGQDLRPCMKVLLESGTQLEGSEGHTMRVAIATEAWNIGLPIEQAIGLFRGQSDFEIETTREHIDYIYGVRYHPYSCNKLRDQCRSLVKPYCLGCSWSNG